MLRFDGADASEKEVYLMNSAMIHRGPDDEGYYFRDSVGLGMRRLSIIDLEGGHQPISSEDGRYQVILNGEIYNYVELQRELIKKGHKFVTGSDTEVIVHLFEEMGAKCVHELNGMFAFAVWDDREKELYLFRDRIGIKPLFYTYDNNSLIFSSELSGITLIRPGTKELDFNSFLSYMGFSYIPYPRTIFKNILKLEPGEFMKISADGKVVTAKYWDVNEFETLRLRDISEYREAVVPLIKDSIRLQMRSDVPVGTFLSGGIDSACIVAFLSEQMDHPVKTFTVGFHEGRNELPYARIVSDRFHTNHTEMLISPEDVTRMLPEIIDKMDEPFYDNAAIPTLMLSKLAVSHGIKVTMIGAGGDELFGGYERYLPQQNLWKVINAFPEWLRSLTGNLFRHIDADKGVRIANPELAFISSISGVNFSFAGKLLCETSYVDNLTEQIFGRYRKFMLPGMKKNGRHALMYLDFKDYLPGDILFMLDKMTMAVSLEGRVPLLDHRIVEACFKIPDNIKFMNGKPKGFLKHILKSSIPDEIMNLPKAGLAGPTGYWVDSVLKDSIYNHLIESPIPFFKDFFNMSFLRYVIQNKKLRCRFAVSIYALYIFSLWYKKHIEGKEIVI